MKKISTIVVSILVTCCLILLINSNYYEGKIITDTKTKNILNTNSLTMMYETDYQSGEYQVSSDSEWPTDGYTFNEVLSSCENGSTLTWDDENQKVLMQANTSDKCYVYFDKKPGTLANYIINNVYTGTDGDNGLYYHDGVGNYTNSDQEAGDNSYRYSGANPNNYVCFGSDEALCPEENLYRIIGVFNNQVKLIKYDYANSDLLGTDGDYSTSTYTNTSSSYYKGTKTTINRYYWNINDVNTWSESGLNTVNLNINYLNNIGETWANKIATTTWQVGGMARNNTYTAKQYYETELGTDATNTTYEAKIGLAYVSEYGYGVDQNYWTIALSNYTSSNDYNWMFMGLNEWTISRVSSGSTYAFSIDYNGELYISNVHVTGFAPGAIGVYDRAIRPTFYLNSDVAYISGTGTQTDPYRIN